MQKSQPTSLKKRVLAHNGEEPEAFHLEDIKEKFRESVEMCKEGLRSVQHGSGWAWAAECCCHFTLGSTFIFHKIISDNSSYSCGGGRREEHT